MLLVIVFSKINCIDEIEQYSKDNILDIFNLKQTNIKPQHSLILVHYQIIYIAIFKDGDVVLSLDTRSGGHIYYNKLIKTLSTVPFNFNTTVLIFHIYIFYFTVSGICSSFSISSSATDIIPLYNILSMSSC